MSGPTCPKCGANAEASVFCSNCGTRLSGAAPSPMVLRPPNLPSRALTIVITALFGVFGVIPAAVHAGQANQMGQSGARYWKAFGWTFFISMTASILATVLLYGGMISALLGLSSAQNATTSTYRPTQATKATYAATTARTTTSPTYNSSSPDAAVPSADGGASSETTVAGVSPVVKPGDVLTTTGIGELLLGMPVSTLSARGVVIGTINDCSFDETPSLTSEGIAVYGKSGTITGIHLVTSQHSTRSGIAVGATLEQVRATYANQVEEKTITYGSTELRKLKVLVVSSGGHDIVFLTQNETTDPDDVVRRIVLIYDGYQLLDKFC
jgi:hypothetical protein